MLRSQSALPRPSPCRSCRNRVLQGASEADIFATGESAHWRDQDPGKMQHQKNRPIFVVGSPRSGTSVLTWCLGQHPDIIPLEESGWMGDLAIDLAIYYQIGTARGEYSLLSSMNVEKAEFFAAFGKSINDLILRHRVSLDRNRWRHAAG